MSTKAKMWCCPECELLCPMAQVRCGVCGAPRGDDVGSLSVAQMRDFTADAAFFRETRPKPKRRKRRR